MLVTVVRLYVMNQMALGMNEGRAVGKDASCVDDPKGPGDPGGFGTGDERALPTGLGRLITGIDAPCIRCGPTLRRIRRNSISRRSLATLLLFAYTVGALGLLPSPRTLARWLGQVQGERFPCEECGCGCASAKECWTHCCCHSEHQRLIWALTHGVMPPASVQFSDEQWFAAAKAVRANTAHCLACVPPFKAELARDVVVEPEPTAAAAGACCKSEKSCSESDAEKATPSTRSGPAFSALSCKGMTANMVMATVALPPVSVVGLLPRPPVQGAVAILNSRIPASISLNPPTPPPRRS